MNEGYRYTPFEYSTRDTESVEASKAEILASLAVAGQISVMELMSFTQHSYDVVGDALNQLESSGIIRKTSEVTDQQNALIGYELAE